jgi:hypothetical protein
MRTAGAAAAGISSGVAAGMREMCFASVLHQLGWTQTASRMPTCEPVQHSFASWQLLPRSSVGLDCCTKHAINSAHLLPRWPCTRNAFTFAACSVPRLPLTILTVDSVH